MRTKTGIDRVDAYDSVSIALHWATFVLVALMFLLALVPGIVKGSIDLHKALGFVVFALVAARLVWRLAKGRAPRHEPADPLPLRLAAKAAHYALYGLLLAAPVLGWLYLEAKAVDVHPFGIMWIEMPSPLYYDRELAMTIYGWKKVVVYILLALILVHAAAALVYHNVIKGDGVLRSMLPQRWRRALPAAALAAVALAPSSGEAAFDFEKFGAELAASLAKSCPMADPGDVAAHESCARNIGTGVEKWMRETYILFGGQQPAKTWLKDKKTSVFRGDLFQDMYMSMYMYTGKHRVQKAPDGMTTVSVQAYFRNKMPAGRYPYPFWHSDTKWRAYEVSNEIRFRMNDEGKVLFAYRADTWTDEARPAGYEAVKHPYFLGEWMWRDDAGGAQPEVTLFSEFYSPDNPNLGALDDAYRKMAINFRDADCTVCHMPEGHRKMNKLTLLQTPYHAASAIDAVLDEVRTGKMPVDDYNDPKPIDAKLKADLLANGEAFRQLLLTADAWERSNNRPKARPAPMN